MQKKIKLISFDFDGTLCPDTHNFEKYREKFVKKLMEEHGLKKNDKDEISVLKEFIGPPKWAEIKKSVKKEYRESLIIPNHIKKVINNLSKKVIVVIFSAASRKHVEKVLERSGVDSKIFQRIYTTRDDFDSVRDKDPWMYEKIAREEKLNPDECIHIGDSMRRDYNNSKKAGFKSFLVEHEKIDRLGLEELEGFFV